MIQAFAAIIPLLFSSSLCQFVMDLGMKPDVTFGEQNDRFDVASIIQEQNRAFDEDSQDYRRQAQEHNKGADLLDAVKDTIDNMRIKDFAYHDKMEGNDGDGNFEKNLQVFRDKDKLENIVDYLHDGRKSGRRGMPPNPENEILFHYGVPVNMKIEGYLQVPLEKR